MIRALALSMILLGLAACAMPHVQPPLTPPAGFAGPRIEPGAFVVDDGARLPYLRWGPEEPEAIIIGLHGMNDHDASFRLAGPWWAERGIATYSFDQRGFGGAPGYGVWAGEAAMTEDLRTVVALVRARHPGALLAVVGESMGGSVAASAFGSDRPPDADRVVLLAPGVWGWSSQNVFNRASLWIAARALGDHFAAHPAVGQSAGVDPQRARSAQHPGHTVRRRLGPGRPDAVGVRPADAADREAARGQGHGRIARTATTERTRRTA